ncbi:hypothetical protein [Sulfuricurvum sp.]|uniref:hypothetical protein n=1 Tax=Sulfuricurvum sp. TaxID=2025608 RepID=UPI0026173F3A|nr:hypothetical protein [Sulfuricurvum sp.]MDD2267477.1 hypothetical protein [Sulfuricurvum sp.]MDD2783975.1 hypothetical protein [Sulfuricurvum sp.]
MDMLSVKTVPQRDEWEIRNDCDTLMRAKEIIEDEERLKAAQEYFTKQKETLEELSKSDFLKKIGFR